jgi:Flp pilus assembly protein TadG
MRHFLKDRQGSVAPLFGVLAVPVIAAVGFGLDYSQANLARTAAQNVADRAALVGAAMGDAKEADVLKAVKDYIAQADLTHTVPHVDSVSVKLSSADVLEVKINGSIDTSLMRLFGREKVEFDVTSEVVRGVSGSLELVLALDNTGSMAGTKIATLKTAALSLIDQMTAKQDGAVKVGLVPFSDYVKVGVSRRKEPWLSVPDDTSATTEVCAWEKPVKRKYDCETKTGVRNNDGVSTTYTYEQCKYEYGDPEYKCKNKTTSSTWHGCVGSRPYPYNVTYEDPAIKIPGVMNISCGKEIIPLTSNPASVKAAITSMAASGQTYIAAGLLWGFNLLAPGAPASTAAAFDPTDENIRPRKALVLMTDGENTRSPTFPLHNGSNTLIANGYTAELCANIKAKHIEIYTVAFEVDDLTAKTLLQQCATDASHYFDASNSAELLTSFESIATSLKTLRIAR